MARLSWKTHSEMNSKERITIVVDKNLNTDHDAEYVVETILNNEAEEILVSYFAIILN